MVGLMTIGLVAVLWRSDGRRWVRWLGVAALGLVILQGVLGGMRVRLDERTLAMLHGVTGPLFFAVTIAMAVFTSRRWNSLGAAGLGPATRSISGFIPRLAIATCILVYLQIVLGAVVRHVPVGAEPATFAHAVRSHLFLAAVVVLHVALLAWLVLRQAREIRPLGGLAIALACLVTAQVALGAATWVVKFAAPAWAPAWISTARGAVQEGGWLETHVITAHVAVGSLVLAASLALALFAQRLLPWNPAALGVAVRRVEAIV
jgi:cytochrome c oxidase assembly protein subunit 15